MTAPAHATPVWFDGSKFIVSHNDQLFLFDPCEPVRLAAFLKAIYAARETLRTATAEEEGRLRFQAAWRKKGAEIRAREEARKDREHKALLKRADAATRKKEAIELLELLGL